MKKKVLSALRLALLVICTTLGSVTKTEASHIFGADFYYTWNSGYTYTVTLVLYGDCSGSSFPKLPSSVPELKIYNGASLYGTYNMTLQAPTSGTEVTPVCAAQKDSTTCTYGTVPGIKKFVFTKQITLSGASANWKFEFDGNMGAVGGSAGRSNSITNITVGGGGSIW